MSSPLSIWWTGCPAPDPGLLPSSQGPHLWGMGAVRSPAWGARTSEDAPLSLRGIRESQWNNGNFLPRWEKVLWSVLSSLPPPFRFFQIIRFLVCSSRNNFGGCLFFQAAHGSDFNFGCFLFVLSRRVPSLVCAVCQLLPVENSW